MSFGRYVAISHRRIHYAFLTMFRTFADLSTAQLRSKTLGIAGLPLTSYGVAPNCVVPEMSTTREYFGLVGIRNRYSIVKKYII